MKEDWLGMKCPTCGSENLEDARFCGSCGVPLSASLDAGSSGSTPPGSTPRKMVSFSKAIKLGFQRYIVFGGRSTRAEYWWWFLFVMVVSGLLSIVDQVFGVSSLDGLWSLATLIPSLALGARRLHDINKSAWWLLMWLFVVIGWIVLIVWAIRKGDEGPNKYGPDPRQVTSQQPYKPY